VSHQSSRSLSRRARVQSACVESDSGVTWACGW
jgi:hypothetical protein